MELRRLFASQAADVSMPTEFFTFHPKLSLRILFACKYSALIIHDSHASLSGNEGGSLNELKVKLRVN